MDNQLATTTNMTTSSEEALFPAENLLNPARSKIFRPRGNFEITSSNNKIHIIDTLAKTATIPVGSYNGGSKMAEAIGLALATVSSNWGCFHSPDLGFSFIRSSSPGILEISNSTNAIWDTIGFTGSTNIDATTLQYADERRRHTSEYIQVDLGTNANSVGFIGLIGPKSRPLDISGDATITVKGTNILDWDTPEVSKSVTRYADGLYVFLDDIADTKYRYWRLEFEDQQNTSDIELSNFYLGTYLTLNNRNVNSGFTKSYVDPSDIQVSENGAEFFLSRDRYREISNGSMNYMDAADRRDFEQMIHDHGIHTPFFVSFDPLQNCTQDITELTGYYRFASDPIIIHFRSDIYSVGFNLKEAL
jgi:hypothetical protein